MYVHRQTSEEMKLLIFFLSENIYLFCKLLSGTKMLDRNMHGTCNSRSLFSDYVVVQSKSIDRFAVSVYLSVPNCWIHTNSSQRKETLLLTFLSFVKTNFSCCDIVLIGNTGLSFWLTSSSYLYVFIGHHCYIIKS
jgi:hypothetical protein